MGLYKVAVLIKMVAKDAKAPAKAPAAKGAKGAKGKGPKHRYSIAVGLKKGYKVTKIPDASKKRPSRRTGALSKKVKFMRDLVREVCGFAPYERRVQELLRI